MPVKPASDGFDASAGTCSLEPLFTPFSFKGLTLANRIVLPPMGFHLAEDGVPGPDVAQYYRRRVEGGAGLIMTEGVYIDHPVSGNDEFHLRFSGRALDGWARVVDEVHAAGGLIMPELWHVGLIHDSVDLLKGTEPVYDTSRGLIGPSGHIAPDAPVTMPMTERDIEGVIDAFARAATTARDMGFDGVNLHGAHGFLIDQFFWQSTNRRTDHYSGSIRNRTRFASEIVAEVRRRVGPDFPILMRISQWKTQDFTAKLAADPAELEQWLSPLANAGVDAFDCSQRRYWQPEFAGSPLNLAGWVKKVTGKPTITVGSVGVDTDMLESLGQGAAARHRSLAPLIEMLERGDFDLVAVGRAQLADPDWARKVRAGRIGDLIPFTPAILAGSQSAKMDETS